MRSWILYSVLRVGLFIVLFAGFYLLAGALWGSGLLAAAAAAVVAALVAFCISYIFFGRLRRRVAGELAASREPRDAAADSDEGVEDAVVDHEQ